MASPAEDRSWLRWMAASVVALALHGLAIGFVQGDRDAGPAAPAIDAATREGPIEIDVGASMDTEGARAPVETARAPAPERRAKGFSVGKLGEPSRGEIEPSPSAGGAPGAVQPQAPPSTPDRRIDLGIGNGDWARWVRPADVLEAPATAERSAAAPPAPVSRTGGLAEALEAHDRQVGIGPAGSVLAAARDAAHGEAAPQLGRATFAVTLLSTGGVEVELTGANASIEAWRAVGASMRAALASKPPSIPPSRKRVMLKLEVVAEEHWPNGTRVRDEGTAVVVAPPKFQAVDEAKEDLARHNPLAADPVPTPGVDRPPLRLQVNPPGVFVEHHGKVCNYAIGVTPLALAFLGGCDPSNIGAKPVRVVSTRILSETAL